VAHNAWPAPEPGDIVWCRFPDRPRDKPGPKPRPALVIEVTQRVDGIEVRVAYGTSQKLGRLQAGEFAIRKLDNAAAYALAGLSYDTKFNLVETLLLPWNSEFFAIPADPKHGQMPKLGSLHSGMIKTVEAALRATRTAR
jgi:hypothetical protein